MTSKEFVIWLKGFVEAAHDYTPTPKQWDTLKEKLAEVKDEEPIGFPFGVPNTTPNTHPFPTWQQPHYPNPLDNPYKMTATPGTTITTTPGYSSITTTSLPSGSSIIYTNSTGEKIF